jgi:hypothetical protein
VKHGVITEKKPYTRRGELADIINNLLNPVKGKTLKTVEVTYAKTRLA